MSIECLLSVYCNTCKRVGFTTLQVTACFVLAGLLFVSLVLSQGLVSIGTGTGTVTDGDGDIKAPGEIKNRLAPRICM